jgi:hypothetical protein
MALSTREQWSAYDLTETQLQNESLVIYKAVISSNRCCEASCVKSQRSQITQYTYLLRYRFYRAIADLVSYASSDWSAIMVSDMVRGFLLSLEFHFVPW